MRDVNATLHEFWSQFGIPAYRSGRVPDTAELPYITYDVSVGDAMTRSTLVAQNWHHAPGATVAAADVLDMIAKAIPHTGAIVPIDNRGYIVLYRGAGDWQSYVQDPEDRDVIGGKTRYRIHYYLL